VTPIKRAWQRLTQKAPEGGAQKELAAKYVHFQRLLTANNQVLTLMADMEEKLSGDYLFDFQYIRSTVNQVCQETEALVYALNALGDWAYGDLAQAFQRIKVEVEGVLNRRREIPEAPLVLDLEEVDASMAEVVGGKNANLGEVRARLGLPTPRGFAVSTYAYKVFLDYNQITDRITQLLGRWRLDDLDSLAQVSDDLKEMIHQAIVPPELEAELTAAYERLCRQEKGRPLVAMRSSAVGEDLTLTFAGQYATYLNVPPEDLVRRYKDIVASLFTPRALFYYKNKGFKEEEMAMGVGVMPMIPARASGVLFTRRPDEADSGAALINAVWGLGKYAVSGVINPDHYLVAYQPPGEVLEEIIPPKEVMLHSRPEGGVAEAPVPAELVSAPCLSREPMARLLDWAKALEEHYRHPQDVEWALDDAGELWLLQTRPLKVPPRKPAERPARTLKTHPVLIDQGTVACRGVGAGPVVVVRSEEDLRNFPQGGVLVARHTSPKYVTVMPQAAAIITDAGSPTGHMALLAREFQIPTIINTGVATKVLQPGQEVTVDANYNNIYAGVVPELLESGDIHRNDLADSPVFQTLKAVVKQVVPLNLINPQDEAFQPGNCRTLHDLVRYGHEFAMREMFRLTESEGRAGGEVVDLETDLPLKIRILDLGGGLRAGWRRKVRPQQIESLPFKAFWQGLAAMPWPQAKPQVKSLASVFASTPEEVAQGAAAWSDQSYAVLSRNYMNFSIRLGYHLSTVEAYISDQINDNYLTFSFRGGGSTPERRERRVRLIEEIIDHLHLAYQRKGDLIEARLAKYAPEKMLERLNLLGKLTLYTKQLDMVMFSDGIVDWYIKDFLREHVGISG
jgi:pyruvate,water dikinase